MGPRPRGTGDARRARHCTDMNGPITKGMGPSTGETRRGGTEPDRIQDIFEWTAVYPPTGG